jgi:hypothetical protein
MTLHFLTETIWAEIITKVLFSGYFDIRTILTNVWQTNEIMVRDSNQGTMSLLFLRLLTAWICDSDNTEQK